MSSVDPIATPRPADLVTFTILVEGEALPTALHLYEATVTHACNRVSHARFVFRDGDVASQTFALSEDDRFKPGVGIEFRLGYHGEETPVFKGVLTRHGILTRPGRPSQLVVECRHAAFRMTLANRWRGWSDSTDSDVLQTILGEHSVAGDVVQGGSQQEQLAQVGATDWDFVLRRARANGWLVLPTLDKLDVQPPDVAGEPVFTAGYGGAIESFEGEIDALLQPTGASSSAWDPAGGEARTGEAGNVMEPATGDLDGATLAATGETADERWHGAALESDELAAWSTARLTRARLARVRATLRVRGHAGVMPGKTITLEGLGARFNGRAFVGAVRQQFFGGGWKTDVQVGVDPAWLRAGASDELLPPLRGLHVGLVRQLASDPAGGARILVELPVMLPGGSGLWARLAQPEAGDGRGFVFRPEIGDEVLVGFFNEDPRHPVVLGGLYGGRNQPHIDAEDGNPRKGYRSREGLVVEFDDDQKVLTLSTPGGNLVVLSDADSGIRLEDQNGNKITLGPDGIAIESVGKVSIAAPSGDVTVEGVNVSAKGNAEARVEGGVSATLSGSGRAVISGGMVMIN